VICPCCSQVTGKVDPLWLGPYLRLTGHSERLYDLLARNFGKPVSARRLHDAMYADDSSGGATCASNVRNVTMVHLRPKLRPYGLRIVGIHDNQRGRVGDGGGHMLCWADDAEQRRAA
jgi:DNA-binding response OmpR family regulator